MSGRLQNYCACRFACGVVALAVVAMAAPARAEQYHTQVREVPQAAAEPVTREDLERQLREHQGNPYGRALTLQHLAGVAAGAGDYIAANGYLEEAIALNALSPPAMQEMRANLAQLQAAAGEYQKVIDTLAPVLASGAGAEALDPRVWLALGNAYAQTGQWGKAVEPLQYASTAGGRNEALYRLQLAVYLEAGRLDAAAEALQALVRLAPDTKAYWLQLAAVNSQRGEHTQAVAALEVAQRRGMLANAAERLQLVRAYLASGAPFEAASQLAAWLEDGRIPANAANWKLLAAAWTRANEYARAQDPLARAAAATGDPELYAQLGQLRMDLADWDGAVAAFERAMAAGGIGDQTGALLLSQGLAYYQLDQPGLARNAFAAARRYGQTAKLADQWLAFLDARPSGLAPLAMQGLAGAAVPDSTATPAGPGGGAVATTAAAAPSAPPVAGVPTTGDPLTPVGAVRAGNAAGTIPPWTGGLTMANAPPAFEPGGRIVNPYGGEAPLFTITGANLDQYKKLLSAGHRALFARYPDFAMPVYPSHRSAAYPEAIYRATLANQDSARLINPDALVGARLGFPFRKPETGVEVLWNHRLRYRSNDIWVRSDEAIVNQEGIVKVQRRVEEVLFGYGNLALPPGMSENIIAYYLMSLNDDGRPLGRVLVHETLNRAMGERRIWVSVPGAMRLFRVPPVGYDNPRPSTNGLMTIDQIDMYNGDFDRYLWRLVGRKEMIVPYNAYTLQSNDISYEELLQPGHPDTGQMRFERHRVWIVEATTRLGEDHQFATRVFYVDEDSWSVLMVDLYDADGNLWRFQVGHAVQYYDLQLTYTGPVFIYDFKSGRYFATRLTNEAPGAYYNTGRYVPSDFRPAALRRRVR